MSIVNLTGNYGYTAYTASNLAAGSVINATGASWNLSNSANQHPDADTSYLEGTDKINTHPFIIYSAGSGLTINGGTISGSVPQTSDWAYTYNNSAAIRIDGAAGVTIDDWKMTNVWDGIRIRPINGDSSGWLVDDTYIGNARDDAIEDDYKLSGTVRDSLFDGVFSGIGLAGNSISSTDGSGNTVTVDHLFMRMQSYLINGEMTHASFFKTDTSAPETTPDIRIIDSVFAIDDVTPMSISRLQLAWANVVESHGNVFLNLTDTPLPSSYPKPPAGFTILQGQEARDYWAECKAAWLTNHDGVGDAAVTALPALPGASPAPPTSPPPTSPPPTTGINTINGTSGADTLTGTAGVDHINGSGGIDKIFGLGGSDTLTGGAGKDKFVFDTKLDGSIDQITDYTVGQDHIYLDNAIFTKLGSGSWSAPTHLNSSFLEDHAGAKADDANDYILYDSNTGILSYDADGSGSGAPIAFAHLTAGLNLSHYDFYVV